MKRVYIANDDHTDYMWSTNESQYENAFVTMLDYYLNQANSTASKASDYQSRFSADGTFWAYVYAKDRPTRFQELMNRIKDGHITIPKNVLVLVYGCQNTETTIRGMLYAGSLERKYNLSLPIAVSMENQTQPYGLVSVWTGSGIKYTWKGVCNCATRVPNLGSRQYEMYNWVAPDGSKILTKWYSALGPYNLGGYAEASNPSSVVDYMNGTSFTSKNSYNVVGAFGKGGDSVSTTTTEFVSVAEQKSNSSRQVIVSNQLDFFQDFEATYGSSLPNVALSYGNEWDLLVASMAETSGSVKRSVEKLRGAESLASLISLKNSSFMNGRDQAKETAWLNYGLYFEHDWTADGSISRSTRADFQKRMASGITSYVDRLHADAVSGLGSQIRSNGSNRFFVFNPLSFARTDYADYPYADTNPAYVVEVSTGNEVPSQIVTVAGTRYIRILASKVPSIGYKVYEIRTGSPSASGNAATIGSNTIENEYYRITLDPRGAITSLIDKARSNREFAGGAMNDLGSGSGSLRTENVGPVSATLIALATSPLTHETRVTLFKGSRRIDIKNEVKQNFNSVHSWAYNFNITSPDIMHEEVGAIIRAKLSTNGGQYSPRNARYDWLTMNHFADITGGGVGVTLSNADALFMKIGNSSVSTLDTNTPRISPLLGGQIDGSSLGIPNQGGANYFLQRYAMQTHDTFNATNAMKFALEHQNPFVTGKVTGGSTYPEDAYSMVTVSNPNVLIWAFKPSEDGIAKGIIMRVWNMSSSQSVTFTFDSGIQIGSLYETSHVETDIGPMTKSGSSFSDTLKNQQLKSYRIIFN